MAKKLTHQQFLDRAREVHGDRYEYIGKYTGNRSKIRIRCLIHGIFRPKAANHLSGGGCPKCFRESKKTGLDAFIKKAMAIHKGKYEYLGPYVNTDTETNIKCSIHGVFPQSPHTHLRGAGCPDCADEARSIAYSKGRDLFIAQANAVHKNKYTYIGDYVNTHKHIEIICPIHGVFKQKPLHHLEGHGCSQCGLGPNISKAEICWLDSLGIPYEQRQITLIIGKTRIKTDAYDSSTNTIYEYYGDYWHGNPARFAPDDINVRSKKTFGTLHQATLQREQLIKQAGYNLISIWESDWKRLTKPNPKKRKATKRKPVK